LVQKRGKEKLFSIKITFIMNQLISLHIEFTLYMNKAELIASYGPIEIIGEAKKAVFNQNKIY